MKHTLFISISTAISMAMAFPGCNGGGAQSQDGMIIIDVENPVLKDAPPLYQLIDTAYLIPLENDTALIKQITKYQIAGISSCLQSNGNNSLIAFTGDKPKLSPFITHLRF